MDILRELSEEELKFIIDKFKENLPYAIKNLYYILSAQKCLEYSKANEVELSTKILPKFYTHRYGIKENCTIFGITSKPDHTVWYFSFDESLTELKDCLKNTKLIEWGEEILFVTIHVEQIQPILDFTSQNNVNLDVNDYVSYYVLLKEEALSLDIQIPDETTISPLEENDATYCNNLWVFRNTKSEIWLKSLIICNGGYGLRDKSSNELLSFAIISDHFAIGVLHTIDKARRKGYGEIVAKYLAKKIAEEGRDAMAFVGNKNHKSLNLFMKIGFKKIGGCNWIITGSYK